jgi:hypothetical protein
MISLQRRPIVAGRIGPISRMQTTGLLLRGFGIWFWHTITFGRRDTQIVKINEQNEGRHCESKQRAAMT